MNNKKKIIFAISFALLANYWMLSSAFALGVVPQPPPLLAPPQDAKPNLSGNIQYTGDRESQVAAQEAEQRAAEEAAQLKAEGDDVVDTASSTSPFSAASTAWRIGVLVGAMLIISGVGWYVMKKRSKPDKE